jgi:dynein heavy chain, axonemal
MTVQVSDYRTQFSRWWISEWKTVAFPEKGTVFDYYVDETQCLMAPWEDRVTRFAYPHGGAGEAGPGALFVPTVEMTRLTYFLDSLVANRCGGI